MKYYKKAAKQGSIQALTNIGSCPFIHSFFHSFITNDLVGTLYYNGEGVMQSNKKAAKYYLEAANQGNDVAQSHIGTFTL